MCLSHGTIDQPIIFKLEMNDVRLGVWRIPYLFRDVQGLLLVSAQNTEYKIPFSFMSYAINRLLSFC